MNQLVFVENCTEKRAFAEAEEQISEVEDKIALSISEAVCTPSSKSGPTKLVSQNYTHCLSIKTHSFELCLCEHLCFT